MGVMVVPIIRHRFRVVFQVEVGWRRDDEDEEK